MCWILLQKAEVEGEVDLYRTAKYMRHNAPGSIPNMVGGGPRGGVLIMAGW